jgi:hypothetical protein
VYTYTWLNVYIYFNKKMKNYIFFLIRVKNTRCQNQKYCFKKKKKRTDLFFFFFLFFFVFFFVFFLPNTYTIYLYETHAEPTRRPLRTGLWSSIDGERERVRESERQRQRARDRDRESETERERARDGGKAGGKADHAVVGKLAGGPVLTERERERERARGRCRER